MHVHLGSENQYYVPSLFHSTIQNISSLCIFIGPTRIFITPPFFRILNNTGTKKGTCSRFSTWFHKITTSRSSSLVWWCGRKITLNTFKFSNMHPKIKELWQVGINNFERVYYCSELKKY